MATNSEQLGAILKPHGFDHDPEGDYYSRWIGGLRAFNDDDGDFDCFIAVRSAFDGAMVGVVAPELYTLKDCPHTQKVLEACLTIAYSTPSLNYEYNSDSGELRATVEIPIFDSGVNEDQILQAIKLLVMVLDYADPVIRHAIRTGEIDVKRAGLMAADAERRDLEDAVRRLGGIEALRRLAEGSGEDRPA